MFKMKKIIKKTYILLFIILFFQFLFANKVFAKYRDQEEIDSFSSIITVNLDGSLKVQESISAYCLHREIVHGIYRDFPTKYKTKYGFIQNTTFELSETTIDGKSAPYDIKKLENGVRVYIGDPSKLIRIGNHNFYISYITKRQLGYFKDHDEFNYNITGNGWVFPTNSVFATIIFPFQIPKEDISVKGYTGQQNSREEYATISTTYSGNGTTVYVRTTKKLMSYEGLTVFVSFPKGYISSPSSVQKVKVLFLDNLSLIVGFIGLILLSIYYIGMWFWIGRDPEKGVIIPNFKPPRNISPAAMRFINRMAFDTKMVTAAIINLAVNGYIKIVEDKGKFTIIKLKELTGMSKDEESLINKLFRGKCTEFTFESKRHAKIRNSIEAFKYRLKNVYENEFFKINFRYLIPSIILSVFLLLAIIVIEALNYPDVFSLFIFVIVWIPISIITFKIFFINPWQKLKIEKVNYIPNLVTSIFLAFFGIVIVTIDIVILKEIVRITTVWVVLLVFAIITMFCIAREALKAHTKIGRSLLDKIEGFKMFLETTEKEKIKLLYKDLPKSLTVFEKFLPYAIAFDIEKVWSKKFSDEISQIQKSDTEHFATWYSGTGSFTSSFGSSLSGSLGVTISSSSTAPGSSGGGGGGSGGGGGGGGGGGW